MLEINNLGGELKSDLYNLSDTNAVTRFVNSVLNDMEPLLTSRQLTELYNTLQQVIANYSISSDETTDVRIVFSLCFLCSSVFLCFLIFKTMHVINMIMSASIVK